MDNFENKIKKIRSTIDEIRSDIDSMKIKNEKTLTHMVQSINNLSSNQNYSTPHQREEKSNLNIISNMKNPNLFNDFERQGKHSNQNPQVKCLRRESQSGIPVDSNKGADTSLDQIEENIVRRYERLKKKPPLSEHREKESSTISGSVIDRSVKKRSFHEENRVENNNNNNNSNHYFHDYISSIPVKSYSRTPDVNYGRARTNREKDSVSDFENTPILNRPVNAMHNNLESSSGKNYNFNYNTNEREESQNIIHNSGHRFPDRVTEMNNIPTPISNNIGQPYTNTENLEKQIVNLHTVVTDLQKKNSLLQRDINFEKAKDYDTDASLTTRTGKAHIKNFSLGGNHNVSCCTKKNNKEYRYMYNPANSPEKYQEKEIRGLQGSNSSNNILPFQAQRAKIVAYDKPKITETQCQLTDRYENVNEEYIMKENSNNAQAIPMNSNTNKFQFTGYNYERIVNEMLEIANNSVTENITPETLVEHYKTSLMQLKSSKLKDEFVEKLSDLYQTLSGIDEKKESTDIRTLWRWIKGMIQRMKDGTTSDESISPRNAISMKNKIPKNPTSCRTKEGEYKEFCENIIKNYYLKDINELKYFVNELLSKNMKNNQRVEKIKRLLLSEPQNGTRYSITNESASVSH